MSAVLLAVGPALSLPYNVALGVATYAAALALVGGLPPDVRVYLRAGLRRYPGLAAWF